MYVSVAYPGGGGGGGGRPPVRSAPNKLWAAAPPVRFFFLILHDEFFSKIAELPASLRSAYSFFISQIVRAEISSKIC